MQQSGWFLARDNDLEQFPICLFEFREMGLYGSVCTVSWLWIMRSFLAASQSVTYKGSLFLRSTFVECLRLWLTNASVLAALKSVESTVVIAVAYYTVE